MTVIQRLTKCSENRDWYYGHLRGLRKNPIYRDKYVAISNRRVVAASASYPAVVKRLYAKYPQKEARTAYIKRVSSKPCVQILSSRFRLM